MEEDLVIAITTESNFTKAFDLANSILKRKYAACISFKEIKSSFWWEGKIEQSDEIQLTIKTKMKTISKLLPFVKSIHSYNNPELIYWKVNTSLAYKNWVDDVINLKDSC